MKMREERKTMGTQPIQPDVKKISGFESFAELRDAMPDDADLAGANTPRPGSGKKRGRRAKVASVPSAPPPPDPMTDPRYREACGNLSCFGGKKIIVRGFDSGAHFLKDESFKLNKEENQTWDDFFYILSKKGALDMGKPIILAITFIIILFSQLGWRVIERSRSPFIMALFNKQDEGEPETPPVTEADPTVTGFGS
jgi:hypothetical protein